MSNKQLFSCLFFYLLLMQSFLVFAQSRQRISFNEDWHFQKTDTLTAFETNFDDASWRKLSVPHDWAIEGPFKPEYNLRTGGLPVFNVPQAPFGYIQSGHRASQNLLRPSQKYI